MELKHQLQPYLKQLRLSGVLETLEVRHRQAVDGQWTHIEFLARLLEDEVERRAQKQLALRLRRSTVHADKTLEGFDFNFNPASEPTADLVPGRLRLHPPETERPHLRPHRRRQVSSGPGAWCMRPAVRAIQRSFINTHDMLRHIHGGRADDSVDRRLKHYCRPDLLVLDDFGLKPLTPPMPEDLYDIINERYEQGSIRIGPGCPSPDIGRRRLPAMRFGSSTRRQMLLAQPLTCFDTLVTHQCPGCW